MSVKQSRTIFELGNSGQDVYVLRVRIEHSDIVLSSVCGQTVKVPFAVQSHGQATRTMVNFLTPVVPLTTAPMGVTRFYTGF